MSTSDNPNDEMSKAVTLLRVLEGHKNDIFKMSISPNGKILASPSNDCTVKLWDINNGECLHSLDHSEPALCVSFSPDGKILASGGDENRIKFWDSETGKCLSIFEIDDGILDMSWSPNGKFLAFITMEYGVFLYLIESELNKIEEFYQFDDGSLYFGLAWSPSSELLGFSSEKATHFFYNVNTKILEEFAFRSLDFEQAPNYCMTWSPDSKYVVIGSADRQITIFKKDGEQLSIDSILEGLTAPVISVSFLNNGMFLSSLDHDGNFVVWLTDSWSEVMRIEFYPLPESLINFAAHPTMPLIAFRGKPPNTINVFQLDFPLLVDAKFNSHSVYYVNAKAVLLGESGVGKSGLGILLAEGKFRHTEGSTHGAQFWHFPTDHLKLPDKNIQAELTLWDLAGQPEYRLTHQLFLDHSDAILLLFDCSDQYNPFRGVTYWAKAIKKHASKDAKKYLVSSRCDVSPITADQKAINQILTLHDLDKHFKTSAATGEGVDELFEELMKEISWLKLPRTSTPRLFKFLREFLLECKKDDIKLIEMDKVQQAAKILNDMTSIHKAELKILIRLINLDRDKLITEDELTVIEDIVLGLMDPIITQDEIDNIIWLLLNRGKLSIKKDDVGKLSVDDISTLLLRYGLDLIVKEEKDLLFTLLNKYGGYKVSDIEIKTIILLLVRLYEGTNNVAHSELIIIIKFILRNGRSAASIDEIRTSISLLKSGGNFSLKKKQVYTIIRLLQNRGLVYHLTPNQHEEWVLLKPELINQYGGSIIHSARNNQIGVGAVKERHVLNGRIPFTGFNRLNRTEELFVLYVTVELFIKHELCIRELGYLVFPSQINITRLPPKKDFPRTEVSYRFSGSIEAIYASLVVRLSYTNYFHLVNQWKHAAEFSCDDTRLGFSMKPIDEGTSELEIYFFSDVSEFNRVTFIRFVTDHLQTKGIDIDEKIKLFCPKCDHEVENPETVEIRIKNNYLNINCLYCDTKILIPKSIEERYQGNTQLNQKQRQLAKNVQERTAQEVKRFRTDQTVYNIDEGEMIHILHISDSHLENKSQADIYKTQLEIDLKNEMKINQLKFLVISGDIANKSTKEEYLAAFTMVDHIVKRFALDSSQIIIAPGNHDLNWDLSEEAYKYIPKRKCPQDLPEDRYISLNEYGAMLRNDQAYYTRFSNFNKYFFRRISNGKNYPLEPEEQFYFIEKSNEKILFLSLNSNWELDHHYKNRASINMQALSKALDRLQKTDYDGWLKIAVWHHPVTGKEAMNADFMQLLTVNNFQICMHGHIHEAMEGHGKYDSDRGIHIIGAGTFGAPAKDQVSGIPLQYNLLSFNSKTSELKVHTRKKEKVNGAWSADARWGDKNNPKPFYTVKIPNFY